MTLNLSEFTNKLQDLCHEGLSDLKVTIDGKEEIEIEFMPSRKSINIRKAHK